MTKDEIKKALEICADINLNCNDCPYNAVGNCNDILSADALKLIIEQEKEIERLKAENEKMRKERGYINQLKEELLLKHYHVDCYQEEIKKQAQIDVLNKAKERLDSAPNGWASTGYIDELIEEVER